MTTQPTTHIAQRVFKAISETLPPIETFSYSAIESLSLSAQSRAFIFAELTFSARALLTSLKSPRFNLQLDAMSEPIQHFVHQLVRTATQLSRQDFLRVLESAILTEEQYLTRPHYTLKAFVFANHAELSPPDVLDRLSTFVEYTYLLDVFKQYLERKKPSTLSAEKFEKVLLEIDSKLCAAYSHEEFMMLFQPLFDFYQRAGEKAVPCQTLRQFLSEKRLNEHLKRIELAMQHQIESLTAEALNDLLLAPLDMLTPKITPQITPQITSQIDVSPPTSTSSVTATIDSAVQSSHADVTLPSPSPSQQPEPQLSPTYDASPASEPRTSKSVHMIDFFEIEKRKLQSQRAQKQPSLPDIRLLISDDERKTFIKRLFKGNEEEYHIAITSINQMKTWREASLFIDREIFSRFKVDEFSSEAVAFVDIVFERFQKK